MALSNFGAGFIAGFGEEFADSFKNRQAEFQKYVDLSIDSAKQNLTRVQKDKARMAQYERLQKQLESKYGLDKESFLLLASKGDINNIYSRINELNEQSISQTGSNLELSGIQRAFGLTDKVGLPEGMTYEDALGAIIGANISHLSKSGNPKSEAAKTRAGAASIADFLMLNPRMRAEEAASAMEYAGYSVNDLANYTQGYGRDVFEDVSIDPTGAGIRFDYDPQKDQERRVSSVTKSLFAKLQEVDVDETTSLTDLQSILGSSDEESAAEVRRRYSGVAMKMATLERKLVSMGRYDINAVMRQDLMDSLIENIDNEQELETLTASIQSEATVQFILDKMVNNGGLSTEDIDAVISNSIGKDVEKDDAAAVTGQVGAPTVTTGPVETPAVTPPTTPPAAAATPSVIAENAALSDTYDKLNDDNKAKIKEQAAANINPLALEKAAEALLQQQGGPSVEDKTDLATEPDYADRFGVETGDIVLSEIAKASKAREDKDGDIASYQTVYDTVMALPEGERNEYIEIFEEIEQDPDIMDVVEKAGGIASAAGNWLKEDADKSAGNIAGLALQGLAIASEGLNRVANFFNLTPEGQSARKVMNARELRDLGKRLYAEGIVDTLYTGSEAEERREEYVKSIAESAASARLAKKLFTEDARIEDAKAARGTGRSAYLSGLVEPSTFSSTQSTPVSEAELSEAAKRAPDHVQKLGGQMSEAWAKAQEQGGKVAETFNKIFSRDALSPRGRNLYDDLVYFNEVGPVGIISDWLEDNPDAPKEEVAEVLDLAFNPRAIGTVGFQDLGLREDVRDIPEAVEELRKVGLVVPVPDDSMDAKARRGTGRTAMIEPVRPSQTPDPLKTARTLARLRRTNPEYFIDTPPAQADGDTASEVIAMGRSRADRAPNNAGLMSRPIGMIGTPSAEGQPELGIQSIVGDVKRLHGASSSVAKRVENLASSGKVKASDVTKLIKQTKALPKSKARDSLLEELYTMRDELNNR